MVIFSDWKFWLFVVGISQIALTTYGFAIIKFNDLKHLSKDVGDIKTNVNVLTSKVVKIDKGLAVQKQRINDLAKSSN
jgi:hypothetical protein